MFNRTRLQLTAWYLLIIMVISIAFSTFIYLGSSSEFDRILRIQRFRIEHPLYSRTLQILPLPSVVDPQVIEEAKIRLLERLIAINVAILLLSAGAGYFLAGRTLTPIQDMVDEQHRFITDASHELHTPLTSLRTEIEVNLRDPSLSLQKAKEVLTSNLEDVINLQALSQELITLTKYEKPITTFYPQQLSIKDILKKAQEKVKTIAKEKSITLKTHIVDSNILGDEKSLVALFVILFDNAIKYSAEKTTVRITAEMVGDNVQISIVDKGIGISEEDIPHIFDRFYRADKSRTKQLVAGNGLGLSIAKRIVAMHNGTIDVTSDIGKGSTFVVCFPVIKS